MSYGLHFDNPQLKRKEDERRHSIFIRYRSGSNG